MKDYFKEFIKEEFPTTLSKVWTVLTALGGGFIPYILYFFQIKNIPNAPQLTFLKSSILLIGTSFIIFVTIFIIRLIRFQINTRFRTKDNKIAVLKNTIDKLNNQVLLPDYLTYEDIKPYVVEETTMVKKYVFDRTSLSFNTYCELNFKVKAGNRDIQFFETRYNSGHCGYKSHVFKDMKISLKNDTSNGYKLKLRIKSSTEFEHIIQVELEDNKLKKGDSIDYTIVLKYDDYQFISDEELKYYYSKRLYPKENEITTTRIGDIGLKRIEIHIEFPNDFSFHHPQFTVLSKSDITVDPEIQRLQSAFKVTNTNYTKKLSLIITNPIIGLNYKVFWKPPSLETLRESNFINDHEFNQIISKLI